MKVISLVTLRVGKPGKYQTVKAGDIVNMDDDEAKDLIDRGFVTPAGDQTSDDAHLVEAILDAITDLPEDAYGKDGKPGVKAIETILGENITAAQRDKAWDAYQQLIEGQ